MKDGTAVVISLSILIYFLMVIVMVIGHTERMEKLRLSTQPAPHVQAEGGTR